MKTNPGEPGLAVSGAQAYSATYKKTSYSVNPR